MIKTSKYDVDEGFDLRTLDIPWQKDAITHAIEICESKPEHLIGYAKSSTISEVMYSFAITKAFHMKKYEAVKLLLHGCKYRSLYEFENAKYIPIPEGTSTQKVQRAIQSIFEGSKFGIKEENASKILIDYLHANKVDVGSCMLLASSKGYPSIVEYILKQNMLFSINRENEEEQRQASIRLKQKALAEAFEHGHFGVVRVLIAEEPDFCKRVSMIASATLNGSLSSSFGMTVDMGSYVVQGFIPSSFGKS